MILSLSSYRLRLPLSLSIAAVVTAFSMAVALGLQTLTNLREDQGRNALTSGTQWPACRSRRCATTMSG